MTKQLRDEFKKILNGDPRVARLTKFGEWSMPGFSFSDVTHWQPLTLNPIMDKFISDEQKNNIVKFIS